MDLNLNSTNTTHHKISLKKASYHFVLSGTLLKNIKDNLTSGSIILMDVNKENINSLDTIIDYINVTSYGG